MAEIYKAGAGFSSDIARQEVLLRYVVRLRLVRWYAMPQKRVRALRRASLISMSILLFFTGKRELIFGPSS
jgi:hypothetical protein